MGECLTRKERAKRTTEGQRALMEVMSETPNQPPIAQQIIHKPNYQCLLEKYH